MDGRSAGDIAKAMPGRSRNSILGAIHRMKDMPRRATPLLRSRPRDSLLSKPKQLVDLPESELLPANPPIYTIDLGDIHCHWPYDAPGGRDFIYCGAVVRHDSPYCPGHSKIAFQPKYAGTAKSER